LPKTITSLIALTDPKLAPTVPAVLLRWKVSASVPPVKDISLYMKKSREGSVPEPVKGKSLCVLLPTWEVYGQPTVPEVEV
jgi:hypothetical protein